MIQAAWCETRMRQKYSKCQPDRKFATRKKGENCPEVITKSRSGIKPEAGMVGPMSQLSQNTVMFVVNLKKSFKVIVKPEKIEQNKPNKQMY